MSIRNSSKQKDGWQDGFICCEHWENNQRKSSSDLPTIIVPQSQLVKLKELVESAKDKYSKNPSRKNKVELTGLKNKLDAALRIIREGNGRSVKRKRRTITKKSPRKPRSKLPQSPIKRTKTTVDLQREVDSHSLKTELLSVKKELKEKSLLVLKQQNELLLLRGKFEYLTLQFCLT